MLVFKVHVDRLSEEVAAIPFAVFSNISSDDKHPLSERLIAEQLCKISEIEKWGIQSFNEASK